MSQFKVGDEVAYVKHNGNRKFAKVIATPEFLNEGTSLSIPEGHVTLAVFSPARGGVYVRANVPTKDIYEAQQAEYDAWAQKSEQAGGHDFYYDEETGEEGETEAWTPAPTRPKYFVEAL